MNLGWEWSREEGKEMNQTHKPNPRSQQAQFVAQQKIEIAHLKIIRKRELDWVYVKII